MRKRLPLILSTVIAVLAGSSRAEVLNVSSLSSVGVTKTFAAGTYSIDYVDPNTAGALYTAFNVWALTPPTVAGCDLAGANCSRGWADYFNIEFDGNIYFFGPASSSWSATPALSFANVTSNPIVSNVNDGPLQELQGPMTFTTVNSSSVHFYIPDVFYPDNDGGVSLSVTSVPEVSVFGYLVVGLTAMGAFYRVRRRPGS